ncbi:hypothetical protein SUDANB38_03380 [Streptomyces sp. enrichment culture]
MTRVWQWNRPVTVREVLEDLQRERSIAYTTVMTVLDNLHQKGWVRREVVGRAYRYTAVSTRAAYSAALMNEAWSQSDNPAAALVAFFGMMSPGQREALNDAIRIVQRDTPETAEAPEGAARPERETPGKGAPFTPGEAPNAPAEGTAPGDSAPHADESGVRGEGQGRPLRAAPPAAPQSGAERPPESPADGFPPEEPPQPVRPARPPRSAEREERPLTEPENPEPENREPENREPENREPGNPERENPEPGNAEPENPAGAGTPPPVDPAEPAPPAAPAGPEAAPAHPHDGPAHEGGAGRGGAER